MNSSDDIKNAQIAHLQFVNGSFVSRVTSDKHGTAVTSDVISDSYWNYIAPSPNAIRESDALINYATNHFRSKSRVPCILVDHGKNQQFVDQLLSHGFTRVYQDAWMFYDRPDYSKRQNSAAKFSQCESEAEMQTFLSTFFAAYSGASSDEPYGALSPEYGVAFQRSFECRADRGLRHFLMSVAGEVVGCSMLGLKDGIACLYGLGVKPQFRKRGFGEALIAHRVGLALSESAKVIFLQTEHGSYNERLFTKFGFQTRAIYDGYAFNAQNHKQGP